MTAEQPLDPKADFSQPFLCEVYLPVFKGIFVAAAHEERELIAISGEQAAEVEPIALRLVIGHETWPAAARKNRAIVAVQNALEFAHLGICHPIVFSDQATAINILNRVKERPVRSAHAELGRRRKNGVVNHG